MAGHARSVVDLAKAIRPELPALLGAEAEEVDTALGRLLARSTEVEQEILTLLQRWPATREWAYSYLGQTHDGGLRDPGAAYYPLTGTGGVVHSETYVCPECDHRWRRRAVGQAVPACPEHGKPLVRTPDSET
ncbi:hypothetical protein DI270_013020 [Microbispora triticiradicis]|uniref:Zinc ribbon domain-containing protein n=1 Tax=Microbispora triticiradicis TaxID=2200763 RepID=A0ABX9LKW5_9ACTN|nr:hypothetical protein [Microbispora triticiradicis]RGA04617.1 hypothetical protein DI270_013020 [Microbispora triticiradicis]GLW25554.1 hypothetical protein Mame01_55960 [Microbispora amethystogenes]